MVVFTCNKCSATLKKNQTHIHVFKCRTPSVSCIDCNQDFFGYSFNNHTQCFTENEKYGKSTSQHQMSKGEAKQEKLSNEITRIIFENKLTGPLKEFLLKVASSPNIPTKRSKFVNFAKTLRVPQDVIEKAWNLLESNKTLKKNESQENQKCDNSDNTQVTHISKDKETNKTNLEQTNDNLQSETQNEGLTEVDGNNDKKKKHKKSNKRKSDEDNVSLISNLAEENKEVQNKSEEKIKRKKKDFKEGDTEIQKNENYHNEENVKKDYENILDISENHKCEKSGGYFSTLKKFFKEQGNELVPFKTVKKAVKRIRREHAVGMSKSEFYNKIMAKIQKKRYFSIEENGIRFVEL